MCKVKIRASRNGKAVSHTWPDYNAQMPTQRNKIKHNVYTPMLTRARRVRDPRQIVFQIRGLKFESSTDAYGFY